MDHRIGFCRRRRRQDLDRKHWLLTRGAAVPSSHLGCSSSQAWNARHHQGLGGRLYGRRHYTCCTRPGRPSTARAARARNSDSGSCAMMGGPWLGRLAIIFVMIVIVKASAGLAYFLVCVSFAAAIALLLYKGRYLPRFMMDILDRLTNKAQLEKAYEAKSAQLTTIDAEDLANKLKA